MARILVIDDDEQVRKVISEMLLSEDHDVVTAPNGQRGLDTASQAQFDLVIADVLPLEHDGLETIRAVRKQVEPLPLIAMSAGHIEGVLEPTDAPLNESSTETVWADAVFAKPFTKDDLITAIEPLLANVASTAG